MVAVAPPNVTVAPAAGADVVVVPGNCGGVYSTTLTVTVAPGAAVAGTPLMRSGDAGEQPGGVALGHEQQIVALLDLAGRRRPMLA